MSTSFGYLNKYGYGGHVFPVVIGETGPAYTDVNLFWLIPALIRPSQEPTCMPRSMQAHAVTVPHNT